MNYKSWLAAGASCLAVAALFAASSATAGKNRYAGTVAIDYAFTNTDVDPVFGPDFDVDTDAFSGSGAILFGLDGAWNAQIDAAFAFHTIETGFAGLELSVDTFRIGGDVFWRDPKIGMFGVELAYQQQDRDDLFFFIPVGTSGDGFLAGLRGEYYFSDNLTLGAAAGFQQLDFDPLYDIEGWYANAKLTYYVNDCISVNVNANYFTIEPSFSNADADQWSVGLEGEYLVSRETPVSVYAGVRWGEVSYDFPQDDENLTAYVGLKFRFGTEGGALVDQDRNNTLTPTTTGFGQPHRL